MGFKHTKSKDSFDLGPMTLILKLNLDMVKMYQHTENELLAMTVQKLLPEQTDRSD